MERDSSSRASRDARSSRPEMRISGGKHTAGPWEAEANNGAYLPLDLCAQQITGDGWVIALVLTDTRSMERMGPHNARLIAAAPELLVALKRVCEATERANAHSAPDDCWSMGPTTGNPVADHIACPGCVALNEAKAARAAIALAEGEG